LYLKISRSLQTKPIAYAVIFYYVSKLEIS
jgi:hypothetical protein